MTDTNNTGCARNQGTTQFCAEAVEAHKELREARAEIERLRSRVGWLDHLDTPEGRAMHASEAVKVENEDLNAIVELLRADLREAMELARERLADVERLRAELDTLRARVAVLERGLVQLVLEDEDAAFDRLDDRLTRCGIMPTQATLDAAKETNP